MKIHSDLPDLISKMCEKSKVKVIHVSAIGANKDQNLNIKSLNLVVKRTLLKTLKTQLFSDLV